MNLENLKVDSFDDMPQFQAEVEKKNKQITKNLRVMCVQQQIVQEQGERYYNDQKDRRIISEAEKLEDEVHRETLKQKIEYF